MHHFDWTSTPHGQSPPWTLSQTDSRRLTMRYGTAAAHSLRTVRSRRQPSSISPETGGSVRRLRAAPSRLDTRDRSLVDLQPPWHAPQSTPDPTSPNHITTCPWRGHKPTRRPPMLLPLCRTHVLACRAAPGPLPMGVVIDRAASDAARTTCNFPRQARDTAAHPTYCTPIVSSAPRSTPFDGCVSLAGARMARNRRAAHTHAGLTTAPFGLIIAGPRSPSSATSRSLVPILL